MLSRVVRSLATMLIGVLLVFLPENAVELLIRVLGVAFLLPALISVVKLFTTRNDAKTFAKVAISVINIGCIAFGTWLLVSPKTFAELFILLLGVALLFFGLFQLFVVFSKRSVKPMHWGFLIVPLLTVVTSVVVLANPFETVSVVSVVIGVCAFVTGCSDLVISLVIGKSKSTDVEKTVDL